MAFVNWIRGGAITAATTSIQIDAGQSLFVFLGNFKSGGAPTVSTAKFDGVDLTQIGVDATFNTSNANRHNAWWIPSPNVGTLNLVFTFSATPTTISGFYAVCNNVDIAATLSLAQNLTGTGTSASVSVAGTDPFVLYGMSAKLSVFGSWNASAETDTTTKRQASAGVSTNVNCSGFTADRTTHNPYTATLTHTTAQSWSLMAVRVPVSPTASDQKVRLIY